jgi:hypothetical protein
LCSFPASCTFAIIFHPLLFTFQADSPRAGGLGAELQAPRNSEVFPLSPPGFASCRVCLALVVWLAPVPLPASGTKQLFSYIVSGSAPCF